MGRASFGGAADTSQLFASLYNQYADRLETLANRAAADAEREQAAADNDVIDKWQQGEMSDEQFMLYVQKRIAESADDPEAQTYWNKIQRETAKSIKAEQISDTAEDIINDINAGTKTYADLLNFYKSQQRGLRPNDPLYEDLEDQIEQVNDRIAENKIAGAISGIDYRFRSGGMTGAQAGAALRAEAARYKANDPSRYYQLLSQALEYEQYGGYYSAGGSGGGGRSGGGSGGGGGSSSASLNSTIDALQGIEDRLGSLSEQFEAGETVGSITYQDASGKLVTEELLLREGEGTPSRDMQAVDAEMLSTLDALEAAYIEKGDLSAAGETNNRKMGYITDHIQPRNTIGPEIQANRLLAGFQATVEAAANSSDPVLAWGKVRAAEQRISRWHRYLNRKTTYEFKGSVGDDKLRENPELSAANRREVQTAADMEDRTTAEFQQQADALLATARAVSTAKNVEGLAAAGDALVLMLGEAGANVFMETASLAVDIVTGIPAGKYARVFVPGEGLVYTPVAETVESRIDPQTGRPVSVPVVVPVDRDMNPLADDSRGEKMETMLMEINGRTEEIQVITAPSYFVGGQRVSESDYQSFIKKVQDLASSEKRTEADERLLAELQGAGAPRAYREALAPRADGKEGAVHWLQDEAGMWHKRRVQKGGGVPFIFTGKDARKAQARANEINPATGKPYDPTFNPQTGTGRSFFNERDYQQKRTINTLEGDGSDWYDVGLRGKREEQKAAERRSIAEMAVAGARMGAGATGIGAGKAGQIIQKQASALGINLGAPSALRKTSLGGSDRTRFGKTMPKMADINIRPVRPVNVVGPSFDAAGLRARLSNLVGRRRQTLANRSVGVSTRPTYAGSDFSGFQED